MRLVMMTRFQMDRARPGLKPRRRLAVILAVLSLLALALPAAGASAATPCRVAVLGDSLTAGYGVDLADAFPARLEAGLRAEGLDCAVIDAGVSGDTSSGGRARLAWVLGDQPSHLIVELGGNDALRALPPAQLEVNLDAIVTEARAAGVHVFLAGMLAPPNLGRAYGEQFAGSFSRVAAKHAVPLYPFFLDGAAGEAKLMQRDGIHPNPAGVAVIVERILPAVSAWLVATQDVSSE